MRRTLWRLNIIFCVVKCKIRLVVWVFGQFVLDHWTKHATIGRFKSPAFASIMGCINKNLPFAIGNLRVPPNANPPNLLGDYYGTMMMMINNPLIRPYFLWETWHWGGAFRFPLMCTHWENPISSSDSLCRQFFFQKNAASMRSLSITTFATSLCMRVFARNHF